MPSDSSIKRNFKKAKAASILSDFSKHKIGAVMMLGNKVLAVGYNITKTNPIQKEYNVARNFLVEKKNNGMVHAEMMCLIKTRFLDVDWSKVSIYVYREHKNHSPAMAKPCPACEKALKERGITQIYYSTDGVPYKQM